MSEEAKTTEAPKTKTESKAKADPFPNKRKYEDGFVFNMPIYHYENRTEGKIRQDLIDAGNEPEVIEPHMDLIREALTFHNAKFSPEPAAKA